MKHAAFWAIVAALVVASTTRPRATEPGAARSVSIPFETAATRHILLKVSVNKSRPLSFVLDTGAYRAIIRLDAARQLGLSLEGRVTSAGAGPGAQVGSRVRDARWSLVGVESFAQPLELALPLPELPSAAGRDIDGIIGGEFIRQFVVEIDYQARTITLHDRDGFTYSGAGETLPIDFNADGHPVVTARVTPLGGRPLERRFMLDTGSGLALALHSPFVVEQNLLGPQSKTIRAVGGSGAGGRTAGRLGRIAALQIGSFIIDSPIAMFSEDKAGAFANPLLAGNIGAQIASRFRLILDYGRKRMILEPAPTLAQPFDRAFSGIALRAYGPDYRTFRVREVLEDSPAAEAGIVEDDVIEAIDDATADRLTLSAINELLEKPARYRLTIRRGERIIETTLTPKRLI
jgi:hypothetical protein